MNRGLGSHRAGGSVADRQDGEISRRSVTAPSVVTNVSRYDVLLDGPVAVLRVDDRVAAVTGERLLRPASCSSLVYDSPLSCRPPQYARLFLPTLPDGDRVVLGGVQRGVEVGPAAALVPGQRTAPHAAVAARPELPVEDHPGVLVRVRRPRAVVRVVVVRVARDVVVPVRPDRQPARPTVGRLEDLLELQVDVAAVSRVGDDVLVVVGLDARVVRRRRVTQCGLRVGQLVGVGDQLPRPGRVARLGQEDALAAQVVGRGVLDDRVQPAVGRR